SRYRAEELIVFAGAMTNRHGNVRHQLRKTLSGTLDLSLAAHICLSLLLDNFFVPLTRRNSSTFWQDEISRVGVSDFHERSARADLVDVFSKNDFHVLSSQMREAKGTKAILRACLIASLRRF